jgi:hypothetical protein
MQLKILADKLRGKISELSHHAHINQNIYCGVGHETISSERMAILESKFKDAENLQEAARKVPMSDKLALLECLKMRESDKILGIDPIDFAIYKQLGIFDKNGNHHNIFEGDNDEHECSHDKKEMTTDEKFEAYSTLLLD